MKKYLFIIAAATIVASCTDNDSFKRINNEGDNATIGFTSFTDKITKADVAENSEALYSWTFYDHQESFQVWARKKGQPDHDVFGGTKVTVEREGTENNYTYKYSYAPARFWDKNAEKYHFYAAAPAQPAGDNPAWKWTFVDTENNASLITDNNLGAGYFKTTSTLNGVNLKHVDNLTTANNRSALSNIFKGITVSANNSATDIDKLVAAPCEVENAYYNKANPEAVNLNFIHILSKLNVTISTSLYDSEHQYDIDLLAFEIHNIPNYGSFDESTAIPSSKKAIRWSRGESTTTTDILTGIVVDDKNTADTEDDVDTHIDVALPTSNGTTGEKQYIVESLIIPQNNAYEEVALDGIAHTEQGEHPFNAPTKPYFKISYSIDGDIFTQYFNLAAAFLNYNNISQKKTATGLVDLVTTGENADPTSFGFYEGWQNTLNIIINPEKIEFTAEVATWSEVSKNYEIDQDNE